MGERINVGQELLNVPFSQMISGLAAAIAEAQMNLDRNTVQMLRMMGDKKRAPVALPYIKATKNGPEPAEITTSMLGAGFQPTFYQFTDTIIEVKMAVTAAYAEEETKESSGTETRYEYGSPYVRYRNRRGSQLRPITITAAPVDAAYCSKYNYSQEGSSTLRTRLVPLPPNHLIQQQMDEYAEYLRDQLALEMEPERKQDQA